MAPKRSKSLLSGRLGLFALTLSFTLLFACSRAPDPTKPVPVPTEDWSQWRGPNRNGIVSQSFDASQALQAPQEIWRQTLGAGFSSPTIADGQLVTMFSDGDREFLIALDLANGQELWRLEMGEPLRESRRECRTRR